MADRNGLRSLAFVVVSVVFLLLGGAGLYVASRTFRAPTAETSSPNPPAVEREEPAAEPVDPVAGALGLSVYPRTHLMPTRGKKTTGDGYVVERFGLELDLGVVLPVNVYRPIVTAGPHPLILVFPSHDEGGKAQEAVQNVCQMFARNDFIAVTFDLIGYGERESAGHEPEGAFFLQAGTSMLALEVWEAQRVIDYMTIRGEVDRRRIGATGFSGGGTIAFYLAAVDPRIKAVSVVAGITTPQALAARAHGHFWVNFFPGQSELPDVGDLVIDTLLPRAVQIVAGTDDPLFPPAPMEDGAMRARQAYCETQENCGNFELVDLPMAHDFPPAARERTYAWFNRSFASRKHKWTIDPVPLLPAGELTTGVTDPASAQEIVRRLAAPAYANLAEKRKRPGWPETVRSIVADTFFAGEEGAAYPAEGGDPARAAVIVTGRVPAEELSAIEDALAARGVGVTVIEEATDAESVRKAFDDAKADVTIGTSRIEREARALVETAWGLKRNGAGRVAIWASGWQGVAAAAAAVRSPAVDSLAVDRYPTSLLEAIDYPHRPIDTYYLSFTDPRLFPRVDSIDLLLALAPRRLYVTDRTVADVTAIAARRAENEAGLGAQYEREGTRQDVVIGPADVDVVADWLTAR